MEPKAGGSCLWEGVGYLGLFCSVPGTEGCLCALVEGKGSQAQLCAPGEYGASLAVAGSHCVPERDKVHGLEAAPMREWSLETWLGKRHGGQGLGQEREEIPFSGGWRVWEF